MSDFAIALSTILVVVMIVIMYGKIKECRPYDTYTEKKHVRFSRMIEPLELLTEKDTDEVMEPSLGWDASFNVPLVSQDEKKRYVKRMQENHAKLTKSMGEFSKYRTNMDDVIVPEDIIDPFKPDHRSERLQGKTIADIYDDMTQPIRAKPKTVLSSSAFRTEYEDEKDICGGIIDGTDHLRAYDGLHDSYKSASFGDEF